MKGEELKAGDRIEAIKRPPEKQTLPVGTQGAVKFVHPEHKGLIWIVTDKPVRAMVAQGRDPKKKRKWSRPTSL